MPNKQKLIEQVASQMMKSGKKGRLTATENQKQKFVKRHEKQIAWTIENMPRSSAAVYAVIVKCLIKYDHANVANFCKSVKKAIFDGQNDPAYVLWKFIQTYRGKDSSGVYQITVFAAKNYMEKIPIKSIMPSKEDIFDWDEEWTVPDDLLNNWNPDKIPSEI
jgi:hypothetical protein